MKNMRGVAILKKLWEKFQEKLNNYELSKKLIILYLFCVLLPLLVTDSIIIYTFIEKESAQQEYEMENVASAVQYDFNNKVDMMARIAKSIYMNKSVNEFLDREFIGGYDYFVRYYKLVNDTMLGDSFGVENTNITMYADNPTIINGGMFSRIDSIMETPWYQYMREMGQEQLLYIYYDDKMDPIIPPKRKIVFIQLLNFYSESNSEKILVIEMDYSSVVNDFVKMNYESPIYICQSNKILFSNQGHSNVATEFENFEVEEDIGYTRNCKIYGTEISIHVLKTEMLTWEVLEENLYLIALLICINMILPCILMMGINSSFTVRIKELSDGFNSVNEEKMIEIISVHGNDEIGNLMRNYNRMVERIEELIQTVYKDKMREQDMDIARKNAELLALQSQINPHFMFNALESIRMHSILKKEYETADMVGKLAIMMRQNVDWNDDLIDIEKEMEFVDAYLGLQKYRFGDRLSYELEIEEECSKYKIPRLTLVTFVENACVHGIESKMSGGWVFVRVYRKTTAICLEIEDTGAGMSEQMMEEMNNRMKNASIEMLKGNGRVGMVNACIRLKILTDERVQFILDGEKGMGTMMQIIIPIECL